MSVGKVARRIEEYLKEAIDVDRLDGPYAVKGIFMDHSLPNERLEVGKTFETGYKPIIQLKLDSEEPKIEKRKTSYLSIDDFSGSAFQPAFA
ncbi:MAG: hypothetical protein GTN76_03920 [Candidatus Aenigmarchaeota archaeon]|nr:hypothetical protein [Candidatus Aenigmarchaeota archaeon]